ncbi:butyrophilin subfamily 3 member A3-like [Engraulis encrasicolus]|uniref:butyrophilin subfamily 3 member A3-like n=1 Tax=Engraulis encrasicolus TaxID=184585 RepID=UPI002FD27882
MAERSTNTDPPGLDTVKEFKVQPVLDGKTAPGFLKIKGKTVTCEDPNKMAAQGTQHPHVLCKERLNTHQHYWEVAETKKQALQKLQSWYVGVCTSTTAESKVKLDLTPENGYWILQYKKGTGFSTNAESTALTVTTDVKILGVYLDCSTFNLTVPQQTISELDSSVILPCQLYPHLNAESYRIQWHRVDEDETTVLLYEGQEVKEANAAPQYRGRASLVGDLTKGDVSLKLENLTLADRGVYVCFVKSETWYERARGTLDMTVVGSIPVMSYMEASDKQMNVTCESDGWSTRPTLTWRDKLGVDIKDSHAPEYIIDAAGLVIVRSWIMVSASTSEWISCSVYLSDQEMRESRMLPKIPRIDTVTPDTSGPWKAAFITVLILALLCLGLLFLAYKKGRISISKKDIGVRPECTGTEGDGKDTNREETVPLKVARRVPFKPKPQMAERSTNTDPPETSEKSTTTEAQIIRIPGLDTVKGYKVEPTLDDKTAPGFLKVKGKSVTCKDPDKMAAQGTQHPHVLCKERLNSHQHYWEVMDNKIAMNMQALQKWQSWYVGVCTTKAAASKVKLPLTPENGYWVLQYQKGTGFSTNAESTALSVTTDFKVLGVYLDCDKHTLSFYSASDKSHICTLFNIPPLKTFIPVVCPGVKDGDSMYIGIT